MPADLLQSTTVRIPLKVYLSTDHVTPATGKTVAITISKNGAAFGNLSAGATNATEIASGWYYVDLSTTDTATLGPVVVLGTAASCDPADKDYTVVKATNRGMTGVADAVAGASGGLLISGSNAGTTTFGALTVTGATTFTGAVVLSSTLGVTGATTFTGVVTASAGIAANITGNLIGTVSTLTTYTGNTPQTGDSYARIGAFGAGLTALAQASGVIVTVNNDKTNYTLTVSPPTAAQITAAMLTQALGAARPLDAIADTSLTLNDAFHCAIGIYAGKWHFTGTTWVCQTPFTGTTLRTFTIDSTTIPTLRS